MLKDSWDNLGELGRWQRYGEGLLKIEELKVGE